MLCTLNEELVNHVLIPETPLIQLETTMGDFFCGKLVFLGILVHQNLDLIKSRAEADIALVPTGSFRVAKIGPTLTAGTVTLAIPFVFPTIPVD